MIALDSTQRRQTAQKTHSNLWTVMQIHSREQHMIRDLRTEKTAGRRYSDPYALAAAHIRELRVLRPVVNRLYAFIFLTTAGRRDLDRTCTPRPATRRAPSTTGAPAQLQLALLLLTGKHTTA